MDVHCKPLKVNAHEFDTSYRTLDISKKNLSPGKSEDIPITITDSDEDLSSHGSSLF